MESTKSITERNNVNVFGNGEQAMVFAHGFGCDQNMWRYITPAFEEKYKIVLFDYVGAGKSDLSAYNKSKYANLNGYAQDLLDVIQALELSNVILVAHSVSGMIGVLACIKRPSLFSQLILVGPSARYINDDGYVGGFERQDIEGLLETMENNYIGWASYMAPAIMKNAERPELGQELTESFCSTDPKIARSFAEATFFSDNRADLPQVETPALILQCSDDLIAPLEIGDYLHKELKGSTLKVMKATGHCPHMSHPQETIDLIKDYLA
ncbi:sigma factor SigB/phosphatase RsbP regulator RsbQ [soil metagenome]